MGKNQSILEQMKPLKAKKKKTIPHNKPLITMGWIMVALGAIGAVLPIVPTTPFLIAAAYFFSKGSPRLHRWLRMHPQLGPSLRDWEDHRVIGMRARLVATVAILVSFSVSTYIVWERWFLPHMLITIAFFVLLFIWTRNLKSQPKNLATNYGDKLFK